MTLLSSRGSGRLTFATSLGASPEFPEASLNLFAYYCLQAGLPNLAVTLFRENSQRCPHSANAYESLGEGLLVVSDTSTAVGAFRRSVAVSSRTDDAARIASRAKLDSLPRRMAVTRAPAPAHR